MSAAAALPYRPFTVEELFELPDDGKRYEIYDGEVNMVPPPNLGHQDISKKLQYRIMRYLEDHLMGELFNAPVAFVHNAINYTEPDLIYVSNERRACLTHRGVEGGADLVVEILSPSTRSRDLGVKKDMYQRLGVPHYWVVDPKRCNLTAFSLQGERYGEGRQYEAHDVFEPTLFPGLRIELAPLWREFPPSRFKDEDD